MSKLTKFIDGLELPNTEALPISFSFHCEVGDIIASNDTEIYNTQAEEKVTAPIDLIPFLP
jgi:hypothetical protein